jgi:hypothetical protein
MIRLNDGSGEISGVGTKNLADGRWHHVVFVRDAARRVVLGYVDGILDLEFTDTTLDISDTSSVLSVGLADEFQNEKFVGSVANVNTYSYALSENEVLALYEASISRFSVD